ncbi:MAG: hypothetical protein J6I84_03740 [Bacilli bacterium]|nr:hypothetical protein [Bacilli bacterium]
MQVRILDYLVWDQENRIRVVLVIFLNGTEKIDLLRLIFKAGNNKKITIEKIRRRLLNGEFDKDSIGRYENPMSRFADWSFVRLNELYYEMQSPV